MNTSMSITEQNVANTAGYSKILQCPNNFLVWPQKALEKCVWSFPASVGRLAIHIALALVEKLACLHWLGNFKHNFPGPFGVPAKILFLEVAKKANSKGFFYSQLYSWQSLTLIEHTDSSNWLWRSLLSIYVTIYNLKFVHVHWRSSKRGHWCQNWRTLLKTMLHYCRFFDIIVQRNKPNRQQAMMSKTIHHSNHSRWVSRYSFWEQTMKHDLNNNLLYLRSIWILCST